MRFQPFILLLGSLAILLTGCGSKVSAAAPNSTAKTLTVFAAASLTDAFSEIAATFEINHPGTDVVLNFAGSQTLRLQIEQGARIDIFASANQNHAQALLEQGLIQKPVIFTKNRLVVIVPSGNPAAVKTVTDLTQPGIKLILAHPTVPAGRYAHKVLAKLSSDPLLTPDISARILANLVSEEDNVKGVVAKVRLGEADAGIVYASEVTPAAADELETITIPTSVNVEATYPLAISSQSGQLELAQQFVDFVRSSKGQTILANHGFQPNQTDRIGKEP